MVKLQAFDTARHLDNPEVISHYLAEAFQSRDGKLMLRAIQNVARAGKIAKIASATGMSRTSLYWRENTSPEFTTVLKVLNALGVRLEPTPKDTRKIGKRLVRAAQEAVAIATHGGKGRKATRYRIILPKNPATRDALAGEFVRARAKGSSPAFKHKPVKAAATKKR